MEMTLSLEYNDEGGSDQPSGTNSEDDDTMAMKTKVPPIFFIGPMGLGIRASGDKRQVCV